MTPEHTRLVVSIVDRKPGCRVHLRRAIFQPTPRPLALRAAGALISVNGASATA